MGGYSDVYKLKRHKKEMEWIGGQKLFISVVEFKLKSAYLINRCEYRYIRWMYGPVNAF